MAVVVLNGVKRIARVASVLVPFMVAVYFVMVLYIIITHFERVPMVIAMIFEEAFNLRAGIGALAGIALIGARRAALVNEAGIGTASIMHGQSKNTEPVREGLVAMLAPAFDSGFVCTCTAMALLLCVDFTNPGEIRGLDMCMEAFGKNVPFGSTLLLIVVASFALSSMFSYSYYGTSCASYLFGPPLHVAVHPLAGGVRRHPRRRRRRLHRPLLRPDGHSVDGYPAHPRRTCTRRHQRIFQPHKKLYRPKLTRPKHNQPKLTH